MDKSIKKYAYCIWVKSAIKLAHLSVHYSVKNSNNVYVYPLFLEKSWIFCNQSVCSYTTAHVFVLRIRVLCAFRTRCTCVEFKLRMKRESTYFETHEYSLAALQRVSTIKYAFLPLANQIVLLQRSVA